MKPRNRFAYLSDADRQTIRDLCAVHTYDEVVDIIGQPRSEGGLGLHTSASSLCRFYTGVSLSPEREVLAQNAAAANIRHEMDGNAFLGAIRATVQARILQALDSGKALADLEKEFRHLKVTEAIYLNDARWRAENPKAARANYHKFVETCADAPQMDFATEEDLSKTPPIEAPFEPTEFEKDLREANRRKHQAQEQQNLVIETLAKYGINLRATSTAPQSTRAINPSAPAPNLRVSAPPREPLPSPTIEPNSATDPQKTPELQ